MLPAFAAAFGDDAFRTAAMQSIDALRRIVDVVEAKDTRRRRTVIETGAKGRAGAGAGAGRRSRGPGRRSRGPGREIRGAAVKVAVAGVAVAGAGAGEAPGRRSRGRRFGEASKDGKVAGCMEVVGARVAGVTVAGAVFIGSGPAPGAGADLARDGGWRTNDDATRDLFSVRIRTRLNGRISRPCLSCRRRGSF